MVKRFLLVVILLSLPAILTGSVPRIVFPFGEQLVGSAEWEFKTQFNNHIGYEITAVVRITTPPGVYLELEKLPDVGGSFDLSQRWLGGDYELWEKLDRDAQDNLISYNGELEVIERTVTQHRGGDSMVTEVTFKLLYLDPIDFNRAYTTKRIAGSYVGQRYLFFNRKGEIKKGWEHIGIGELDFHVLRRVEEGDQPIFSFIHLPISTPRPYFLLQISGIGIIAGAVVAHGWSLLKAKMLRRREARALAAIEPKLPTLDDLYKGWVRTRDYKIFLEAVKLYRRGFWGKRRPMLWIKTTFILYSGRTFSNEQVEEVLSELVRGGEM